MSFDQEEYEKLQKKLAEMKKDENFGKYVEAKKAESNKYKVHAEQLFTELKKRKFSNEEIITIANKLRSTTVSAIKKENKK